MATAPLKDRAEDSCPTCLKQYCIASTDHDTRLKTLEENQRKLEQQNQLLLTLLARKGVDVDDSQATQTPILIVPTESRPNITAHEARTGLPVDPSVHNPFTKRSPLVPYGARPGAYPHEFPTPTIFDGEDEGYYPRFEWALRKKYEADGIFLGGN
jgi:hypothetical protein